MGIKQTLGRWAMDWGAAMAGPNPYYSIRDPRLAGMLRGLGSTAPTLISLRSATDIAKAWEQCPPMVAIICGKALADITGKITFKYADSDEEVNLSKQLQARAMHKLMMRPNPLQTWRQFRAQQKIYTQLFGFCPVLTIKPAGFTGPESVKMMWNLPPQYIEIETTGKLFFQTESSGIFKRISFAYNGEKKDLPIEDIFFLKDQYVSLAHEAIPSSRVSALQYPISNIVAAYEASNVLITKRGAMGILSNAGKDVAGARPVREDEKEQLQADWARYGLSLEDWQIIITSASLQWQQIALPIKELMLFETIEDGTRQCCAVFNYPYGLLPKQKADTFTNKAEDKKSLYQDAIIPEADADMEVYNEFFQLNKTGSGIVMSLDYSHLEVFQVSETDKAAALKGKAEAAEIMYTNNMITLNRMREMLGENTVAGDDIYYYEWQQAHMPQPEPGSNPLNANQNEPAATA